MTQPNGDRVMKRITVESVVEAYAKTGLKPSRFNILPEGGSCCPLGALYVASTGGNGPYYWASCEFGPQYYMSFAWGFDGKFRAEELLEEADFNATAYSDGVAVRNHFWPSNQA